MAVAYHTGKQDKLGYVLAAISWRETDAGENLVNYSKKLKDVNAGAFQNKLSTVGIRENCTTQQCYRNIAIKLMIDREYAASSSLIEMKYWLAYYKNNMSKALASYNSGFRIYPVSKRYAVDVMNKASYLRQCHNFREMSVVYKTPSDVLVKNQKFLDIFSGAY